MRLTLTMFAWIYAWETRRRNRARHTSGEQIQVGWNTNWVKTTEKLMQRKIFMVEEEVFYTFPIEKKIISAQLPNSTLNSRLLHGRESAIEREARGLWCQEHIDACLCNHRNLWMESTGSQVWTAAVIAGKRKKPGDFMCVNFTTRVMKAGKTEFADAHVSSRTHFGWVFPAIIFSGATPPAAFCLAMCHDVYLSRDSCLILLSMVSNKSTAGLYYKCDWENGQKNITLEWIGICCFTAEASRALW